MRSVGSILVRLPLREIISQLLSTELGCDWTDGMSPMMFTPDRLVLLSKLRGFLTMVTPAELNTDLQSLQSQLDEAIAAERESLDVYVDGKIAETVKPLQEALDGADGAVKTLIAEALTKVQAIVPSEAPATTPVITPIEPAPVSPEIPVESAPVVDGDPVAIEPEAIG